jgi:predicted GTPase
MPYGDLARARVQRFAAWGDLDAAACTIEEREEYEPHLAAGNVVFAGVDYGEIVARAQAEADLILWDGGNNDFPFVRPDLHIVLVDALRPGQETTHHPGEAVLRMADIVLVAKADAAPPGIPFIAANVRAANPRARLLRGASPVTLDNPAAVRGRRVLAVEDGPTITHGGMPHGAAVAAALQAQAASIVDPRPRAAPDIAGIYEHYPHIGPVLPAMGYSSRQIAALAATLNAVDADVIVAGTPVDLARLMKLNKPIQRARYEFAELEQPGLWEAVERFLDRRGGPR